MKYVYPTLNWIFGIFFLLFGVRFFIELPIAGFCLFGIAILLLPPVRRFAHSKTNLKIPLKVRIISIFILVLTFGFFLV